MKKAFFLSCLAAAALISVGSAHAAYTIFFGEDRNNSETTPLSLIPNSAAAEAAFRANLAAAVRTEDFEAQIAGAGAPLTLQFTGSAGPGALTAKLAGGFGLVTSVPSGMSQGGRYSIPFVTTTNFWDADAGGHNAFIVEFPQAIAAFGFYAVDIGDFGGQLYIDLFADEFAATLSLHRETVNHSIGSGGSTGGSVLYFGLTAGTAAEAFRSIKFSSSDGAGDAFAFDNFTIADFQQLNPNPPSGVPEPGSLALVAGALLGLGLARRRG